MHRSPSLALLFALTIVLIGTLAGWAQEPVPPAALPAPTAETPAPTAPTETATPAPAAPTAEAPEPVAAPVEKPSVITSIQVAGYAGIAKEQILAAITSKEGQVYSEEQVARDREAIVRLGWFETVSVAREVTESGIALTFRVVENPVVSDIQFEGNAVLTRAQLLAVMETKQGQVFNNRVLAEDSRRIMEAYRSEGYILALVLGRSMSAEGVLTIGIAEGVIEAIRITGNTRTKDYVIRRYLRTKPGDVYNYTKVAADANRLSATRWFESVQPTAEVGSEPGKVILIITIVERKHTGQATVGGGYSSVQGLVGFVDLTKENLRGTGQALTVRTEVGGRSSYELYYRHPWILTPETRLNAGLYNRLVLREAFVAPEGEERRSISYYERRTGGSVTLGRPLSDRTTVFLGVRSDRASIRDLEEEEEELLSGSAFQPRDVRSISTALASDSRDNVAFPRRGGFHQLSAEFAGVLGGSSDFNKYSADVRRYHPVGARGTLAARLLLGTITGDAPYLEQFLIGGTESLRGYRTDRFVGTHLALLNAEYRHSLGKNLVGVAFVDVGDAWGGPLATDDSGLIEGDENFTAHVGYGVGIRVATPIGPLRLDLGFGDEGTQTHFSISQMF